MCVLSLFLVFWSCSIEPHSLFKDDRFSSSSKQMPLDFMKPNGPSTKYLFTEEKGGIRDALGLGARGPRCRRLWAGAALHPLAGRGDDPAQAESQTGEETRTCQAQVAQHHHISIFIECCCLSNVKLGCYLRMCRFSTNADILALYYNSFSPFHYFFPNQRKSLKASLHFPPPIIRMDLFSIT